VALDLLPIAIVLLVMKPVRRAVVAERFVKEFESSSPPGEK